MNIYKVHQWEHGDERTIKDVISYYTAHSLADVAVHVHNSTPGGPWELVGIVQVGTLLGECPKVHADLTSA